jgi:biopolymer transport protein ExbB/TolQ
MMNERTIQLGAVVAPQRKTGAEQAQWLQAFAPTLVVTLAGLTVFRDAIGRSIASSAHPALVYIILLACLFGLMLCALTLNQYQNEARAVRSWRRQVLELGEAPWAAVAAQAPPRAPLVTTALAALSPRIAQAERQARFEVELATVSAALSERLAYVNYLAGALIGLGLVGTFVGLLGTLEDLGAVFGALADTGSSNINPTTVFASMVQKLQDPMKAMGTAFVASLYGLMGSLLVGLCALTVSRVGQDVIAQLRSAARALEARDAVLPAQAAAVDSDAPWAAAVHQLQTLQADLLSAQLDQHHRLCDWLDQHAQKQSAALAHNQEVFQGLQARLSQELASSGQAQTLALERMLLAHRDASDRMVSQLEGALIRLSQVADDQGRGLEVIAERLAVRDEDRKHSVDQLLAGLHVDRAFLKDEVITAFDRRHDQSAQQLKAVSQLLSRLVDQLDQSSKSLEQLAQSQPALQVKPGPSSRRWWWPWGASKSGTEAIAAETITSALRQVVCSVDQQSQLLAQLVQDGRWSNKARKAARAGRAGGQETGPG